LHVAVRQQTRNISQRDVVVNLTLRYVSIITPIASSLSSVDIPNIMTKSPLPTRPRVAACSIGQIVARVMPRGTRGALPGKPSGFADVPPFPPNLFAAASYLLHISGAYHHIAMDSDDGKTPDGAILVTEADRRNWTELGKSWATGGGTADPPAQIQRLWKDLYGHFDEPIVLEKKRRRKSPTWWKLAYALMAIADEASAGAGFLGSGDLKDRDNWIARVVRDVVTPPATETSIRSQIQWDNVPSITTELIDQDVVCVQAKARTPTVGAALRNMSHNLAMLPPRRQMSVHWQAPFNAHTLDDREQLNLMLIPFPYTLGPADFSVVSDGLRGADMPSGWFEIQQSWLATKPQNIVGFVKALVERAGGRINGIVFPELSLNWLMYECLASTLRDAHYGVEFLVAGSSDNCARERGNFALGTHFFENPEESSQRIMASMSRSKHHRWALNSHQIERYQLESAFSSPLGNRRWWERIPLSAREMHVNAFRQSSVFTVMICEDLARSDPAHEPLRAVGPNLVFVLLMDGPQIPSRWSARYSLSLADDPGCSVLTLTSRALVARANASAKARGRSESWSVALWQDGDGYEPIEIECKPGIDAVVVTLEAHSTIEATLDGRSNTRTYVWRLKPHPRYISLPDRLADLRRAVGAL